MEENIFLSGLQRELQDRLKETPCERKALCVKLSRMCPTAASRDFGLKEIEDNMLANTMYALPFWLASVI